MAFSSDGKTIAVTRRSNRFNENIFLVDLATRVSEQLTQSEEDIVGLAWHPDGSKLIYGTQKADVRQGYILDMASKQRFDLNIEGFSYPAFASKSGQLFFQQRPEKYHIASLPLNQAVASSPFPVVESEFNHHHPDYSTASKKMVYVSNESGFYELYSANSDGSERRQLTDLKTTIRYPRWSHDGHKIAFMAPLIVAPLIESTDAKTEQASSTDKIYILALASKKIEMIPSPFKQHNHPTWSFDDSAVITAIYDHEFADLYQINIADGTVQRLTFDGGRFGMMTSPTTMLYTRIKNGLWQKEISSKAPPLNKMSGQLFKTLYAWDYRAADGNGKGGVYFRQNEQDYHQIAFYDFNQQQLLPLVRLPKRAFENYGSLSMVPEHSKLLFTGSHFPQADIKMLEHPLLR
ncbi:MAG: Tol biopolymer transport system component [Phenylobacterium sp.]|jgi:Tol biopolymer transport system component